MKKRIIVCSSMIQLLNTQASIIKIGNQKEYKNILFIVNPVISDLEAENIVLLSNTLNINIIHDLRFLFDIFIKDENTLFKKIKKKILNIKKSNLTRLKIIKYLKENNFTEIDTLFSREKGKFYEILFITSIKKIDKIYCIEDGVGDYINSNFIWKSFIIYEIKNFFKNCLINLFIFFYSWLFVENFNNSLILSSIKKIKFNIFFRNIHSVVYSQSRQYNFPPVQNVTNTGNEFKLLINKISTDYNHNYKVIIFDSILNDKLKTDFINVTKLYNSIISKIMIKHSIGKKDILFKHHPRIAYKYWKILKSNINCQVYDYEYNFSRLPGEFMLLSKSLIAVYSVGSSSLFYAKMIFNIESYFILINSKYFHPSAFLKYKNIFTKFNFKIFNAINL